MQSDAPKTDYEDHDQPGLLASDRSTPTVTDGHKWFRMLFFSSTSWIPVSHMPRSVMQQRADVKIFAYRCPDPPSNPDH